MHIIVGSQSIDKSYGPFAVGIGIFDGVHRGHVHMLQRVIREAKAFELRTLAYTFDPHPAELFAKDCAPKMIEPLQMRLERLSSLGFDAVLVERFSPAFAAQSPEYFVKEILLSRLYAQYVVVGENFRFGKDAAGDVGYLQEMAKELGFKFDAVGLRGEGGNAISSTRIRRALEEGDLEVAEDLLGRPYTMVGVVIRGKGRGRGLGFPTANLRAENACIPAHGVYPVMVWLENEDRPHPGVCNIGMNPTFEGEDQVKVEVHLLDYQGSHLYGSHLRIDFFKRIRAEQKFDSVELLKKQIRRDSRAAGEYLKRHVRSLS